LPGQLLALIILGSIVLYRAIQGRIGHFIGVALTVALLVAALKSVDHATTGVLKKHVLVIVEDRHGNVLGRGVWANHEKWQQNKITREWVGEAFAIRDRHGRMLFVAGSAGYDAMNVFMQELTHYRHDEKLTHLERATREWAHLKTKSPALVMEKRFGLLPLIAGFTDLADPQSMFFEPQDQFVFILQPTELPLSTGIAQVLPWMKTKADGTPSVDFSVKTYTDRVSIGPSAFKFPDPQYSKIK
jgi:hypothetical protein